MTKLFVLYYSMYGHIETMANSVVKAHEKWMASKSHSNGCLKQWIPPSLLSAGGKADQVPCRHLRQSWLIMMPLFWGTDLLRQYGGQMRDFPRSNRRLAGQGGHCLAKSPVCLVQLVSVVDKR